MSRERTIEGLIEAIQAEARREPLPVDLPVYEKSGKDPTRPILFAGSLDAPVCFFGRDLGKDEVKHGQPLIGAGGSLIRRSILRAFEPETNVEEKSAPLENALKYTLLTNTVPYKPSGNKAYPESIKQRLRPFVLELLTRFWTGSYIIPLGTEAFHWFAPYLDADEFQSRGQTDERFETTFHARLPASGSAAPKPVFVMPVPHPSPLNRRWLPRIPELLAARFAEIETGGKSI